MHTLSNEDFDAIHEALLHIHHLIDHKYTSTSAGMNALQEAANLTDDALSRVYRHFENTGGDCEVSDISSCMCSRGVKGCTVNHTTDTTL